MVFLDRDKNPTFDWLVVSYSVFFVNRCSFFPKVCVKIMRKVPFLWVYVIRKVPFVCLVWLSGFFLSASDGSTLKNGRVTIWKTTDNGKKSGTKTQLLRDKNPTS